MNIVAEIQKSLKAPKGQTNKFGKYKYRSCEDIVEAVKPLLSEHNCHLNITDEMVMLGDRFYIKATASIIQEDDKVLAFSNGFARETLQRKGMDESQITGATSSYARKYALNGLFAIDDTKDADTTDNREIQQMNPEPIRTGVVDRAEAKYRELLDSDEYHEETELAKEFQKVNDYLSNDERMSVAERFKDEKWGHGTKKNTNTVISEYLKLEVEI